MLYQLVNGVVSTDGMKAIILGVNIDQKTTTVTVLYHFNYKISHLSCLFLHSLR